MLNKNYYIDEDNHRVINENIVELAENEIFVFGSNLAGKHGKGAAYLAWKRFGAEYNIGVGLCGNTYGIPTKDFIYSYNVLSLNLIQYYVNDFIDFTIKNKDKIFLVTQIGCGLAGYKPKDIAPLFIKCKDLQNVYINKEFWKYF